jgi:LmbE family N-acetylglucosaminyl deacetylase
MTKGGAKRMKEEVPSLLAIGAHTGDVEVTMGALISLHIRAKAKATICHLTLGEGGHKSKSAEEYAPQRRREAEASARILGAELAVLPFPDVGFAGGPEVVRGLVEMIRRLKPGVVLSHWPGSFHSGHTNAANCALQAVEEAAGKRFKSDLPPHKVGALYCPENWEDPFHFTPDFYVDVSAEVETWERSCREHELFRGGALAFRYLDYYRAAMARHGAVAGCAHAVALACPPQFSPRLFRHLPFSI